MAPFKLKFRMGSSRSTSQEHDPDPQVNEALLNHHQNNSTAIGASSSTIDSADCNSLASMGTNERKSLLPSKANNLRLGYLDHKTNSCNGESSTESSTLPTTPPPSYEHVLEEKTRLSQNNKFNAEEDCTDEDNQRNSIHLSSLEHLSYSDSSQCNDPNCQENYICNEENFQRQQNSQTDQHNFNEFINEQLEDNESEGDDIDNRKESIDSTELLITTKMSASSNENQNLAENCHNECEECSNGHYEIQNGEACNNGVNDNNGTGQQAGNNDFFDPLINHGGYCNDEAHYDDDTGELTGQNQMPTDYDEKRCDSDSDDGWNAQMSNSHLHSLQQQQQQQQQAAAYSQHSTRERALTPEIISNKSSKEIYKDLAKQWGITCKMSDTCRCMECQSHYFDCEFDENEHQKTDGGLGAGTPMFISEVMHGSACNIL